MNNFTFLWKIFRRSNVLNWIRDEPRVRFPRHFLWRCIWKEFVLSAISASSSMSHPQFLFNTMSTRPFCQRPWYFLQRACLSWDQERLIRCDSMCCLLNPCLPDCSIFLHTYLNYWNRGITIFHWFIDASQCVPPLLQPMRFLLAVPSQPKKKIESPFPFSSTLFFLSLHLSFSSFLLSF